MQGATTTSMLAIDLGVATPQLAPCRRNPKGAGVFGPQALSFVGHDDKASFRFSFRACDPNTPARDPTDFRHGLLGAWAAEEIYCESGIIGPDSPDFSLNRTTIRLKIEKIWPRFSTFSLRSLLPPRLLAPEHAQFLLDTKKFHHNTRHSARLATPTGSSGTSFFRMRRETQK